MSLLVALVVSIISTDRMAAAWLQSEKNSVARRSLPLLSPNIQYAACEALLVAAAVVLAATAAAGGCRARMQWSLAGLGVAVAAGLGATKFMLLEAARITRGNALLRHLFKAVKACHTLGASAAGTVTIGGLGTGSLALGGYLGSDDTSRMICLAVPAWGFVVFVASQALGKPALELLAQAPAILCVVGVALINIQQRFGVLLLSGLVLFLAGPEVRKAKPSGALRLGPDDLLHILFAAGMFCFKLAVQAVPSAGC